MIEEVPIVEIRLPPYSSRLRYDHQRIVDLASTILQRGLIEPIVVRPKNGCYELVAGRYRLEACKWLNRTGIPAIVRNLSDVEALETSLLENLQREDPTPFEVAESCRLLMEKAGYNVHTLALTLGKDEKTVYRILQLVDVPREVREVALVRNDLTVRHGLALLKLQEEPAKQLQLAESIVTENLSGPATVQRANKLLRGDRNPQYIMVPLRLPTRTYESLKAKALDGKVATYVQKLIEAQLSSSGDLTAVKKRGRG